MLEDDSLVALLITNSKAGVELSHYSREFTTSKAPVIALVSEKDEDPEGVVTEMDADGFIFKPFSAKEMQERALADPAPGQHDPAPGDGGEGAGRGRAEAGADGQHHQHPYRLLPVRVHQGPAGGGGAPGQALRLPPGDHARGAGRHPGAPRAERPTLQRDITGGLAVAIAKSIRDIDIPIHYADDRILVFLPHTDLAGAEEVGRRIKRRIKRITYRGEGVTAQLTASVGVAGISAGENLTFSRLIKDASAALKAAQLKGGDRVMKRVSRAPADK